MTVGRIELGQAPEGYRTVTPYLVVKAATNLISFLKDAFGAEEIVRYDTPDGHLIHAEIKIGDSLVMVGDSGEGGKQMPGMMHLYVKDADAVYNNAILAGATSLREPATQEYGDRSAGVTDAFGNQWWFATRVEDLTPDQIRKRMRDTLG